MVGDGNVDVDAVVGSIVEQIGVVVVVLLPGAISIVLLQHLLNNLDLLIR
jgi:hypothetical protein